MDIGVTGVTSGAGGTGGCLGAGGTALCLGVLGDWGAGVKGTVVEDSGKEGHSSSLSSSGRLSP